MKILRAITSFYPIITGPANQAYKISLYLNVMYKWWSPIVTYSYDNSFKIEKYTKEVTVIRLPIIFSMFNYSISKGWHLLISKIRPTIIHVHGYRNYFADISYVLRSKLQYKLVISCHGSVSLYKHLFRSKLLHMPYFFYDLITGMKVLKKADAVIVSSTQEKEEVKSVGVEESKIWIIPMGLDENLIQKIVNRSKPENEGKKIVLSVGRWEQSRRLEIILLAIRKVVNHYKDFEVWIVGPEATRSTFVKKGYMDFIKRITHKLSIQNIVKFKGELTRGELPNVYENAYVFIYTSLYENFGQTLLEAASFGVPIISTPVGIAPEIIKEGVTGFLINFDDYNKLAEKLLLLLYDEGLRNIMSNNIKKVVKEKFSFSRIMPLYKGLYESLV